jgi:hypothetical protein
LSGSKIGGKKTSCGVHHKIIGRVSGDGGSNGPNNGLERVSSNSLNVSDSSLVEEGNWSGNGNKSGSVLVIKRFCVINGSSVTWVEGNRDLSGIFSEQSSARDNGSIGIWKDPRDEGISSNHLEFIVKSNSNVSSVSNGESSSSNEEVHIQVIAVIPVQAKCVGGITIVTFANVGSILGERNRQ